MRTLWQDLRHSARMLMKKPGFTLIVILTLALGVGANTAIFSVVNAVLLRPLPYQNPDRLVRLWESNTKRGLPEGAASAPNFEDWRKRNQVFEQLAAQETTTYNLTGGGEPERVAAANVTANLFPTLGVSPALGRNFLPEEEQGGGGQVALLSYGLWQRRFGADPKLIGRSIQLNGAAYTVVGVMPDGFQFPQGIALWTPLVLDPAVFPWRADRSNHNLSVIGRLKPGVSLAEAQAAMDTLTRQLEQEYPASNAGWGARLRTFYDWLLPEELRRAFWVLLGAVGFMLLIVCANVANLLLARATSRRREVAIRSALGASRARLMRQFFTESMLLALLGGVAGLLFAWWGMDLLVTSLPQNVPRLNDVRLDSRVLGFTLSISMLASVIFGLAPALQASRANLSASFKEGGGATGGARRRMRHALVVVEIALAVTLLIGAGLLAQSFVRLGRVAFGFDSENLLAMQTALPVAQYREKNQQAAFYRQALERIRVLPGVVGASAVIWPALGGGNWAMEVTIEGRPEAKSAALSASARAVMPNFFGTMRIPILRGRDFTEQDDENSTSIIISDAMARRFWPNEDPIGKRFRPGVFNSWMTVVGVVGDVRDIRPDQEPAPAFYFSAPYLDFRAVTILVRGAGNPESLTASVRAEIAAMDRNLPVYNIRTMSAILSRATDQPRFQATLLGLFALVALILATMGVYGVMSYAVTQRAPEIGVRMALGAQRRDVLKLILGGGMAVALSGVTIGLLASIALTRLLKSLLFGVSATDPLTFGLIALLLILAALLACWIPARRATKVDPIIALRYE
jgi:putative ABC transport system permease protein